MEMKAVLMVTFGIVLVAIGTILIAHGFQLRDLELRVMKGELIPFEVDSQKPIEIQIGGIHVIATLDELGKGFNLSQYVYWEGFDYPFKIVLKEGSFLISVTIYNANGEIVAKIVDNQWVVNENKIIARDRNYNAYAFEVIDSDLVPVVQVVFSPQNKMYLGGLFYGPTGRMFVTPNVTIFNPSSDDIKQSIQPIFLYPSEEHLGAMVNQPPAITKSTWVISTGAVLFILGSVISSGSLIQEKRKKTKRRIKRIERCRKEPKKTKCQSFRQSHFTRFTRVLSNSLRVTQS